ncbi:ADP-heptose--LPS heptosyltransferase [Flavobacterium gilvum]|nr:ADP-heptose--LPS heptosyltransferase [Flavobacterium gilvum]
MNQITKNIGNSYSVTKNEKIEIQRVLICRPNKRLGNLLLITPLLEDVSTRFPDCKIDLFVKGFLAPILFENYKNVDLIFKLPKKPFSNLIQYFMVWFSIRKHKYDIVINVDVDSSSGRLATKFSRSKFRFFGETAELSEKHDDDAHIAKYPVYNFRNYLNQFGFEPNNNPVASLNLKLDQNEIEEGKKTVRNLVRNENKTICLFTHATGSKCYSEEWWDNFYQRLKKEYSGYNFIEILPVENISKISFKEPTFYSKNVREIGAVIANTELFIGADSGIMHLASSTQIPIFGLFSVTNLDKYRPYDNRSVGVNTNVTNIDECIKLINNILLKKVEC